MRRAVFAVFFLFVFLLKAQTLPYDAILAGGTVVDGSGNPWFRADLAIRGEAIAAMGNLGDAPATLRPRSGSTSPAWSSHPAS